MRTLAFGDGEGEPAELVVLRRVLLAVAIVPSDVFISTRTFLISSPSETSLVAAVNAFSLRVVWMPFRSSLVCDWASCCCLISVAIFRFSSFKVCCCEWTLFNRSVDGFWHLSDRVENRGHLSVNTFHNRRNLRSNGLVTRDARIANKLNVACSTYTFGRCLRYVIAFNVRLQMTSEACDGIAMVLDRARFHATDSHCELPAIGNRWRRATKFGNINWCSTMRIADTIADNADTNNHNSIAGGSPVVRW